MNGNCQGDNNVVTTYSQPYRYYPRQVPGPS